MPEPASKPKLFLISYGCQMNEYDSAKMAEVLARSHGYERTQVPEDADLLLMNTCSVRDRAQEKVFSELGKWRDWKAGRPGRVIGVGGCVASQEGEDLVRRAPQVDLVFGPQTLHRLPELLNAARGGARAVDVSFPEIEKFDRLPEPRADGPTAYVSIIEGCSRYCSFCVVPYTRGEEVSRPLAQVLAECRALVAQGVREITLLGQNVNAYAGPMDDGGAPADLALLLRHLAKFDGLARIRLMTSHPVHFGAALIEAYAQEPKLGNFLHLPVQSGADRILGMMKRGHTRAQYVEKIRALRAVKPRLSLSSDFIVGFPGETEADFEQTLSLIDECGFDCAYSFAYSPRPGTPAANLRDAIGAEEKQRRLALLQARIRVHDDAFRQRLVGTVQPVLVEHAARKGVGQMAGRTPCNRWVNFDAPPALAGRLVDVEITESMANSLRGRLARAGALAA